MKADSTIRNDIEEYFAVIRTATEEIEATLFGKRFRVTEVDGSDQTVRHGNLVGQEFTVQSVTVRPQTVTVWSGHVEHRNLKLGEIEFLEE